jgi:hypothetical protein
MERIKPYAVTKQKPFHRLQICGKAALLVSLAADGATTADSGTARLFGQ